MSAPADYVRAVLTAALADLAAIDAAQALAAIDAGAPGDDAARVAVVEARLLASRTHQLAGEALCDLDDPRQRQRARLLIEAARDGLPGGAP